MFCVVCRKHQEKLEKDVWLHWGVKGVTDNFKRYSLSDHDWVRCTCKLLTKVNKYIESTKCGKQYRSIPVSLHIPKNALILKRLNWMQATEKAELIKTFEVAYLSALKGRPFSNYSSLLDKINGVKFLKK